MTCRSGTPVSTAFRNGPRAAYGMPFTMPCANACACRKAVWPSFCSGSGQSVGQDHGKGEPVDQVTIGYDAGKHVKGRKRHLLVDTHVQRTNRMPVRVAWLGICHSPCGGKRASMRSQKRPVKRTPQTTPEPLVTENDAQA